MFFDPTWPPEQGARRRAKPNGPKVPIMRRPTVRPKMPLPTRRLPKLPLGPAGLLTFIDFVEPLLYPRPYKIPNPLNGWRKCWGDCAVVVPNRVSNSPTGLCSSSNLMCLGGQGSGAPNAMTVAPTDVAALYGFAIPIFGSYRQTYHSYYRRDTTVTNVEPAMVPSMQVGIALLPDLDPNEIRWLPSPAPALTPGIGSPWVPDPMLDPEIYPDFDPYLPAPITGPMIAGGLAALPWWQTTLQVTSPPLGQPDTKPNPRSRPLPRLGGPIHRRAKPDKKTKEGKVKGPIYYGFMIANAISEGAEVVDAIYEALPKKTRNEWKCKRKVPFIDTAGQYGIDNADCKAKAIWHNVHKIDWPEAIRNIIANQAEDQLIGGLQRYLPRNMINAAGDGQYAYAQLVNAVLEEIGLKDGPGFDDLKPKVLSMSK